MAHTKGPWRTGNVTSVVGRIVYRDDGAGINHVRICRNVASEADARLIVAAPDLLEALEHILSEFGYTLPLDSKKMVQDAIAKAAVK